MGMRDAQRSQAKPDKMPRDNEMHDVNHDDMDTSMASAECEPEESTRPQASEVVHDEPLEALQGNDKVCTNCKAVSSGPKKFCRSQMSGDILCDACRAYERGNKVPRPERLWRHKSIQIQDDSAARNNDPFELSEGHDTPPGGKRTSRSLERASNSNLATPLQADSRKRPHGVDPPNRFPEAAAGEPRKKRNAAAAKACAHCKTTETRQWLKRTKDSTEILCSACYQYEKKKEVPRPESLWDTLTETGKVIKRKRGRVPKEILNRGPAGVGRDDTAREGGPRRARKSTEEDATTARMTDEELEALFRKKIAEQEREVKKLRMQLKEEQAGNAKRDEEILELRIKARKMATLREADADRVKELEKTIADLTVYKEAVLAMESTVKRVTGKQ